LYSFMSFSSSLPNSNAFGNVGPAQAVFGMAVFFGGAAQFIAGLLQFRVGNTFGCTLHCSYGAFWLAYAMFLIPSLGIEAAYNGDTRAYSVHLGIFNILWSLLTWLFFIAALRTNITILGVLFSLAMAFFLLAVANFIETTHTTSAVRVNRAGAAFAIISAILALYAGISGLMVEDTTPVRFPLGELPLRRSSSTEKHADKERVN
jgi:succinate-acetate transporter protein